jgi:hypothetical protein
LDALAVKAREQGRRRGTVKAFAMKKDPYLHSSVPFPIFGQISKAIRNDIPAMVLSR